MGEALICKNYKKVAFANLAPKEAIFTRLRCKMWSCPACAKTNQWVWRNWLIEKLPKVSDEWWILTLTANSQTRGHQTSMDNLRTHLDAFFKRMKRLFGSIEYVRVYEKHPKSEAVHVHIIICGLSPYVAIGCSSKLQPMAIACLTRDRRNGVWALKTWVKKTAQELHMGYIADIQKIVGDAIRAVWYVTKYLTKSQADLHVKGLRHVQVTSGIGSPPQGNDNTWYTASYIVPQMFEPNCQIKDLNTGYVIDNNHWERVGFYPDRD